MRQKTACLNHPYRWAFGSGLFFPRDGSFLQTEVALSSHVISPNRSMSLAADFGASPRSSHSGR